MPTDPSIPPSLDPDRRLNQDIGELQRRVDELARFLQGGAIAAVPVVSALPTAGRKGRMVMLDSDSKVYADNGSAWVAQT